MFTDLQVNLYHYKGMDSNLLYIIKKLQGRGEIRKKQRVQLISTDYEN